jgi:hypothetical protein
VAGSKGCRFGWGKAICPDTSKEVAIHCRLIPGSGGQQDRPSCKRHQAKFFREMCSVGNWAIRRPGTTFAGDGLVLNEDRRPSPALHTGGWDSGRLHASELPSSRPAYRSRNLFLAPRLGWTLTPALSRWLPVGEGEVGPVPCVASAKPYSRGVISSSRVQPHAPWRR